MRIEFMKWISLFNFTINLIILGTCSLPVFAQVQSERYPTDAEIQRLIVEFRRDIPRFRASPDLGGDYLKHPRQKQLFDQVKLFERAWSQVDPAIAPFLGSWNAGAPDWSIYPSTTKGRVCVIFNQPSRGGTPSNSYFSLGSVSNGQLRIKGESFTGESFRIFIRESNYLGGMSVINNRPGISAYVWRSPLTNFIQSSITDSPKTSRIIQQFKAAGCTASLPNQR
jgi:hypothetical protein